ncbi:MAG: M23 family metallopeptidase [Ilumatobacteraceae bacterium]
MGPQPARGYADLRAGRGTVVSTQHWDSNWWNFNCVARGNPAGCITCGNGVSIQTTFGLRHTYCHNSELNISVGDVIVAGQHIATSGSSGRSGVAHLHLELRWALEEQRRCPQPLLTAIYDDTTTPNPASLPIHGCTFESGSASASASRDDPRGSTLTDGPTVGGDDHDE